MTERYTNLASSTLNGAILIGATTLVVTSATLFPSLPQFRLRIESELLLVTGVSGTTFTVTRGIEGTTAAPHADTTAVDHIVTAAALAQILADVATPRFTPIDANTFLHVALNETVGSTTFTNDGTGGGTLALTGTPTVGYPGIFGSCIQFNGTNRYYVSGLTGVNGPVATAALTVSCWVQIWNYGGLVYQQIVVKEYRNDNTWNSPFESASINLNNSGDGRFVVSVAHGTDGSGALTSLTSLSPFVVPLNVWTFLALTYDGTHLLAYWNGLLAGSLNVGGNVDWNVSGNPGPWVIGSIAATAVAGGSPVNGLVDDVRAEGVVRSPAYLAAQYNKGIGYY